MYAILLNMKKCNMQEWIFINRILSFKSDIRKVFLIEKNIKIYKETWLYIQTVFHKKVHAYIM